MSVREARSKIPLYLHGKIVAVIDFNRSTMIKKVRGSKHLLLYPEKSWATDLSLLNNAIQLGALYVEIQDVENSLLYKTSIETIQNKSFVINRGFGVQLALPLRFWEVSDMPKETAEDEKCRQLSFEI